MANAVVRPNVQDLEPTLAGLDSAIAWLRDRGTQTQHLALLFGTTEGHIRQLAHRGRKSHQNPPFYPSLTAPLVPPANPLKPTTADFRKRLGVRPHHDFVILGRAERRRLSGLEEKIEEIRDAFWSGVRYGVGLSDLYSVLPEIGYPAYSVRLRLLARLRFQIAVLLTHIGRTASALDEALRSLHLSRIAYEESDDKFDLARMADSAQVVAQAYVLRSEPQNARVYLEIHRQASKKAGLLPTTEYYRLMGVTSYHLGDENDELAKKYFSQATQALQRVADSDGAAECEDALRLGARQVNLMRPVNWEGAQELFKFVLSRFPLDHIQVSMNLHWTVACGFSTDSPSAHRKAQELLRRYRNVSAGYGHQATITRLLQITPMLPATHRPAWARRALYENALRNS